MGSPVQKPALHRSISTKVLLSDGEDTPFTEHCRHYEASYRVSRGTRVLARAEEPGVMHSQGGDPATQPRCACPCSACRRMCRT